MGKRIILIDAKDPKTPLPAIYGKGLEGDFIYTLDQLESLPYQEKMKILTFKDGDAVMLVGGEPFKYLRQYYHYGVRNENYVDCSRLYRLSMTGGGYAKCTIEIPEPEDIATFLRDDFTEHVNFKFLYKNLKTYEECMRFLDWADLLPPTEYFGFDYEASGLPLDKWFELSGAALCNSQYSGFLSFTDLRHSSTPEQYQEVLKRLGNFLERRQEYIVVYNMQYEFQVSRRMLGVTLYNLQDAQVINVVDGHHKDKKYSLKWTAQRVLGVQVWDHHFDKLSDLMDSMFFEVVGKLKAEKRKVIKVTPDNYDQTPEWKEIMSMYPEYEDEFRRLIQEYWGYPFMCIPSDILALYCCLDSFYTLQMFLKKLPEYTEECWKIYMDNARFGSRLMSGGIYINEEFRLYYKEQSEKMMAWGITYCAMARCMLRMKVNEKSARIINKYPRFVKLLLEKDYFKSDKVLEVDIVKNILSKFIDKMDAYETGVDEGALFMEFGPEFAEKFIDLLKQSMEEIKFKGKIDETVVRKKKILSALGEKLAQWIELDKIDATTKKHKQLEEYLYYQRAYEELERIVCTQLKDMRNIPEKIKAFGQILPAKEYSDYISENYFKCKSPDENNQIINEMAGIYKKETAYLGALMDSINQLPGASSFYKDLGIMTPQDGYSDFLTSFDNWWNSSCIDYGHYPLKVYEESIKYLRLSDPSSADTIKNVWTDFSGFLIQKQLWPEYTNTINFYETPFQESDLFETFSFIRKFTLNYLTYKKYAKVLSTYIDGMFKAKNKWVIEEEDHIPLREADPTEPGAIEKCFFHLEVNTKASTRSSSGFHTIISHSDLKDCITTPPTWDEFGNIKYGTSPQLLSYYDISSAEVKGAGYASGDPNLIYLFDNGIDVYINTARLYYKDFDSMPKGEQKKKRKEFKTVFLGILYGLGVKSLAERLNCSEDDARSIIDAVYQAYPKLREYIASQQQYPFTHDGAVNTFFGNRLVPIEWEWYKKSTDPRDQRQLKAKIQRLGVNYPIQGSLSSAMCSFFFETYRQSMREGWKYPLEPYIIVHDSSTCAFPVSKIFEIKNFYDTYFTEYGATIGPKIKLLFDLLEGNSYESASEVKQKSPDIIEFTANAKTLLPMFDKITTCPDYRVEAMMVEKDKDGNKVAEYPLTRDMLVPAWVESPMERFIDQEGTCVVLDKSKYTITFKKL